MKLRICGNSIRLRLLRNEVKALYEVGKVIHTTRFGPAVDDERLIYSIESSEIATSVSCTFIEGCLAVFIPIAIVRSWARSNQVSIRAQQPISKVESLSILIEKDFQCLDRQREEDDSEAFPNPLAPVTAI